MTCASLCRSDPRGMNPGLQRRPSGLACSPFMQRKRLVCAAAPSTPCSGCRCTVPVLPTRRSTFGCRPISQSIISGGELFKLPEPHPVTSYPTHLNMLFSSIYHRSMPHVYLNTPSYTQTLLGIRCREPMGGDALSTKVVSCGEKPSGGLDSLRVAPQPMQVTTPSCLALVCGAKENPC